MADVQLTKNFNLGEPGIQCPCGHCNGGTPDPEFMVKLQELRDFCGFPFNIDSLCRCHEHNKEVGGKEHSYHINGRAADIEAIGAEKRQKIIEGAGKVGLNGIGIGPNFVHVDNREYPYRWTYPDSAKRRNT